MLGIYAHKHNYRNQLYFKEIKMEKIKMTTPLVEMDGDEMTRIL